METLPAGKAGRALLLEGADPFPVVVGLAHEAMQERESASRLLCNPLHRSLEDPS